MEVNTVNELKSALRSDADEIVTYDKELLLLLRGYTLTVKYGPYALAAVIAAIPVLALTGPVGAGIGAGATALGVTAGSEISLTALIPLATLAVAIGGALLISLYTDWECVELPGGIKFTRKSK